MEGFFLHVVLDKARLVVLQNTAHSVFEFGVGTTKVRESEASLDRRKSQTDESRLVYNGCIAEL